MNLKQENTLLKQKLARSKAFIEREILAQKYIIDKQKEKTNTQAKTEQFFTNTHSSIYDERLRKYFGETIYPYLPAEALAHSVSAEYVFARVRANPSADGFAIIAGYLKALDVFIEDFITKPFRSFALREHKKLVTNSIVEKNLHRVIYKGHSLSLGRLYEVLSSFPEERGVYAEKFFRFLGARPFIEEVLLSKEFLADFKLLLESEATSTLRHRGVLSMDETKSIRKLLFGDFETTKGFMYKFAKIGEVEL